jgi:hypothetical protein
MLAHLAGLAALIALLLAWVGVQRAWLRVFGEAEGADALAGRASCAGTACAEVCERRTCEAGGAREEGSQ